MGRLGDGMNEIDDEGKTGETGETRGRKAGGEDAAAAVGGAGGAGGAAANPALAAARAALAALDKANSESESNRDELAAAWQALSTLGVEQGGGPVREDSPALGGRRRAARVSDTEWALPVVDAPPSQFDVSPEPAPPPSAGTPSVTEARGRGDEGAVRPAAPRPHLTGAPDAEWAAPVLDAPPAPQVDETPAAVRDTAGREGRGGRGEPVGGIAGDDEQAGGEAALFGVQRPAPPVPGRTASGFAASARFEADQEPDESVLAAVRDVLSAGGAPVRFAEQAVASLGPEAAVLLHEDPWNLLALPGISPRQADMFAEAALGRAPDPDEPRRTRALLLWHLADAARRGDTAVDLVTALSALEGFGVRDGAGAVRAAYEAGRIMAFAERPPTAAEGPGGDGEFADDFEGGDTDFEDFEGDEPVDLDDPFEGPADRVLVALERHALAEESIADAVLRLLSTAEPADGDAFGGSGLAEALRGTALALYVTGPGEDPPKAPLDLVGLAARAEDSAVVFASPTVDGRSRVAEAAPGVDSVTVHDLLAGTEGPGRTPEGLLDLGLLIVGEAHLLDVQTAASLLEAVPDGARVVLCGDPDELEPASPGRVFGDLVASGTLPVVASRTKASGVLGTLAAAVRGGTLPPVDSPDREVVLVGARGAAEAVHRCVQLVADSIPRALGIPVDDVLVVTPANDGSAGTTALNTALKARLNPGPGQYAGFDIGDRVVRVPTPRATGMVEGRVVEAVPDGLAVEYRGAPGQPVTVPRARLGELRHGWAVTVRQALGVRRPGVVAMLPGDAGPLVTRALVYTAFTRARRHLSIVYPVGGTLPQAVARPGGSVRTTRLAAALRAAAVEAGVGIGADAGGGAP